MSNSNSMSERESEFEDFVNNFWDNICLSEGVNHVYSLPTKIYEKSCKYLAKHLVANFGFHHQPWMYPDLIRNKWLGLLEHYDPS